MHKSNKGNIMDSPLGEIVRRERTYAMIKSGKGTDFSVCECVWKPVKSPYPCSRYTLVAWLVVALMLTVIALAIKV